MRRGRRDKKAGAQDFLEYPVLALGSVVFRTIEAVSYTAAVVSLLSILPLGQQLATAPTDNRAAIQIIADSLLSMREHSTLVAAFALTLGALMYYTLFYQARLVPRWLSGWGIAATLLMMTACLLSLFSNSSVTGYTFLFLPLLVQEMVLAGWLLVKGVSPSPLTSRASTESSTTPGTNASRSAAAPTSSGSFPTAAP